MPKLKYLDLQPIGHEERAPSLPIALGGDLYDKTSNILEVSRKKEKNMENGYKDNILNCRKPTPSGCNSGVDNLLSNFGIVTTDEWGAVDRSARFGENTISQNMHGPPAVSILTSASPPTYSSALQSYSALVNHSESTACPSMDSTVPRRSLTGQNYGSGTRIGSDSHHILSTATTSLLLDRNTTDQQIGRQSQHFTGTTTREVEKSTTGHTGKWYDGAQGDEMRARAIRAEGDEWKWPYSLADSTTLAWLRGVSEMSIRHMCASVIRSNISEYMVYLPSLSILQLLDNNFITLTQVLQTNILVTVLDENCVYND